MIQRLSIILLFIYTLSSCVSHKNVVYLQGDPINDGQVRQIKNEPYHLQVDDVLRIEIKAANEELVSVFKNTTMPQNSSQLNAETYYFSGYSVDKQGFIDMPFLKRINVLGFTTDEIQQKITKKLSQFFKNAEDIFVSVKLAGVRYTIIGEVGSTGSKVLYQNNVNIIQAIANAGDIKLTGDKTNIEVIRIGIEGVEKFHIDLTQITAINSDIFYIQPNDIIHIPALKQKTYGTGTTGAQSLTTIISVLSLVTTTYLLIKSI